MNQYVPDGSQDLAAIHVDLHQAVLAGVEKVFGGSDPDGQPLIPPDLEGPRLAPLVPEAHLTRDWDTEP